VRVSVILPTRDRRELLAVALASALARTGPADEVIVIDDGSVDGTVESLSPPPERVRLVRGDGGGAGRARNLGIAAARGRFLAFLDSDDIWLPGGLDAQIDALRAEPAPGFSHARAEPVGPDGEPRSGPHHPPVEGDALLPLLRRNPVTTSTVVLDRSVLEEVGPFDEELTRSMDRDLWIRIAERRPIHYRPETVCRYRFHPGQQIRDRRAVDQARCRILEKALERYRRERPGLVREVERLLAYRRLRLGRLLLREGDREGAAASFAAAAALAPVTGRLRAAWYRLASRRP
jgi:glycosyltransferase involved in cell wall biosynthesis